MRIVVGSVKDFIEHLKCRSVIGSTVYINRIYKPTDRQMESGQHAFQDVLLQLYALVSITTDGTNDPNAGEALLECGIDCGRNYPSESVWSGTDCMGSLVDDLDEFCEKSAVRIMPGMIDI